VRDYILTGKYDSNKIAYNIINICRFTSQFIDYKSVVVGKKQIVRKCANSA